jgi:hypothetical protein
VRRAARCGRLRARPRAAWRIRFLAERVFGTSFSSLSEPAKEAETYGASHVESRL